MSQNANQTVKQTSDTKKITWYSLAFMAFSTVWGFGNVVNGFGYFNGIQVIFSWIMMFALYFVPYSLMVGELGSAFKEAGGGVTSWVQETTGSKMAYYVGYTYWVVHIPYIASKGSVGLKALSWVFLKQDWYNHLPAWQVQLATGVVFVIFLWIASKGLTVLKPLTTTAGSFMFIMSLLYILLMFIAPMMNPGSAFIPQKWDWSTLIPTFNVNYFTSLSILVFAVGGCEKISPYVNKVNNPGKNFPKGMIALAIMVVVCAILGTVAMGLAFSPVQFTLDNGAKTTLFAIGSHYNEVSSLATAGPVSQDALDALTAAGAAITQNSFIADGQYLAFQELGEYLHMGKAIMIVYAICNAVGQFSTLVLSIDAPLRMLLDDANARQFVPKGLLKQNKYGAYTNGILMVGVLSGAIIVMQLTGSGAADIIQWLTKLNSVCMPMRYLWVFFAYIMLRKAAGKFKSDYVFVKNNGLAITLGGWCFFVTAFCCLTGVYVEGDMTRTILNIAAPVVLLALGLIMPEIRKMQDIKHAA